MKLPKMKKHEINELIREQMLCRISFKGTIYPYTVPFQYVQLNNSLYFHFTNYGKKMRLFERDKRVCVEIERYKQDLSEYGFVVLRGKLKIVTDPYEKDMVIKEMAQEGEQKLSENFLLAHGIRREEGWSSLIQKKDPVIVKLEEIAEVIGIKSPSF